MMTIIEFFKKCARDLGAEEAIDYATEMYEKLDSDEEAFYAWAEAQGIDLEAWADQYQETWLTLWIWAMCGD